MPKHLMPLLCVAAVLAGCGSREPAKAEAKEGSKAADKKKAGEITLTEESQKTAGIQTVAVKPERLSETLQATGQFTVNEDQTWSVGALLDGRIVSVAARVGDRVKAGAVLARIHSHEVHDARAAYKSADLELARAKMAEGYALRLRDRARRLFDLKAGSQQELDAAEAGLRNAQSAVRDADVKVEKERTHIVEFLEIPIQEEVHSGADEDDYVPVKAPAAGMVIERKATPGTVVSSGNEIFRITSTESLWMMANVNEADLGQLRIGQAVRILVRAFPNRPFRGKILRLGEQLDATTRTLQVRVFVENPGNILKPEMFATAEIESGDTREALFVPDSAAQDLNGSRVVFVRTGPQTFEPRSIEVVRTMNNTMEVAAGLKAGDIVVVKGSFVLKSQLLKSSLEEED
ncbi:MAG: efflux RND transporter periplasmic adaptor subunit [Bryobacteraceae bacterium]|nr:efflux RND transporter periplasmic adaptor subunit [Bryobacteraceae bacterium]